MVAGCGLRVAGCGFETSVGCEVTDHGSNHSTEFRRLIYKTIEVFLIDVLFIKSIIEMCSYFTSRALCIAEKLDEFWIGLRLSTFGNIRRN